MTKRLAVCLIALIAGFATATSAQEKQALQLVQTIPLPGVTGRLDHMGVDLERKRLFVAAVANNTLEVVDLAGAKVIKSLAGLRTLRTHSSWAVTSTNYMYPVSTGTLGFFKARVSGRFRTSRSSLIQTVFSMTP
jgi:hypothetical protein